MQRVTNFRGLQPVRVAAASQLTTCLSPCLPPAAAAPQQDRVSSAHAFMLNVFVPLPLHCPQPQHPDWTAVIVYPLLMHCGL